MKRTEKFLLCFASGLALCATACADDVALSDNPYGTIIARNVFGLLPPPTNAPVAVVEPPVKITPNGIMSIFGQLQVIFKAQRPGQPKEDSYVLSEGQRQDDIEVTKIDDKASIVTFNNHGVVQALPLANKPASSPGGPAGNPVARFPGFPAGRPMPGGAGFNNFGNGAIPFGGRNPGGPGDNNPNPGANPGGGIGGGSSRIYQPEAATMTPEAAQINIVAKKVQLMQQGNPMYKAYPPTLLDRQAGIPDSSTPVSDGTTPP